MIEETPQSRRRRSDWQKRVRAVQTLSTDNPPNPPSSSTPGPRGEPLSGIACREITPGCDKRVPRCDTASRRSAISSTSLRPSLAQLLLCPFAGHGQGPPSNRRQSRRRRGTPTLTQVSSEGSDPDSALPGARPAPRVVHRRSRGRRPTPALTYNRIPVINGCGFATPYIRWPGSASGSGGGARARYLPIAWRSRATIGSLFPSG